MAGISALIGLKATVLFIVSVYLRNLGMKLLAVPLLYASIIASMVAIASHPYINLPLLLGKSSDGSFPLWAKLVFAPFLGFIRIFVFLRRSMIREPVYTEISEGLYVGGWPSVFNHLPPGDPAVIDCTCELPRSSFLSKNAYLCIATWDTRAPQPADIESAVHWACRKRTQNKPVYIHCAYGHGRSVCIMCAVLVTSGVAEDWKNAEKIIQQKRPCIRMNALHRKSLEEWSKYRLSSVRGAGVNVSSMILSSSSDAQ